MIKVTKKVMIEFFSGSKIMADTFKEKGYKTLAIDNDEKLNPDVVADILHLEVAGLKKEYRKPYVLWFGVPCTKFSVAGRNNNFIDFVPQGKESAIALALVYKCLELIEELQPKYWFIENPMGYLRKFPFMRRLPRKEVWYCQYGDKRAKPTDIWTNADHWIPKKCFNENPRCDHERSPRGSKRGTQGLSNAYGRGIYPKRLCEEIVKVCDESLKNIQAILR